MPALARSALAPSRIAASRPVLALAGVLLSTAAWLAARHVAPASSAGLAALIALAPGVAFLLLAVVVEDGALPRLTQAALGATGIVILGSLIGSAEARLQFFGLAMVATMGALGYWLIRSAARRPHLPRWGLALFAATAAALGLFGAYLVLASRDLMIADFMNYRNLSIAVATMIDERRWPLLIAALVSSVKEDYSWAPALAPGVVMALTAPLSRAIYTGCLIVFYAAPAYFAIALLTRDLLRRAGYRQAASAPTTAFAVAAAFAAYPAGLAVAARGMPDIGGLALCVLALRLADKLARLLALRPGHDLSVAKLARRTALALALCLFSMFLFRRWYAFAAIGVIGVLAIEIAGLALRRGRDIRWREATMAAAVATLALVAMASPIIVDWLPNLAAHDYAAIYAAYRKPPDVVADQLGHWIGVAPCLAALAGAVFLWARSRDGRLLRLTIGGAIVAAALFLRVQTPYIHHLYLIAPALMVAVAAPLTLLFARDARLGLAALAALAALTLTPLAGALAPLTPTAGLPNAPRADLGELARMKAWVDARARADHRVCGLGSSYTFSGQLIGELWQLEAKRSPVVMSAADRVDVKMSDVDTVEGPPAAGMRDCALILVGDPVQTHLIPAYQQNVVVPSREMLNGEGIGAKYRRTGEVFHLEGGVRAVVFERVAPVDEADMAALAERWRGARRALGFVEASPALIQSGTSAAAAR